MPRHEGRAGVRVEIETRSDRGAVLAALEEDVASKRNTYDLVLVPNRALGRRSDRSTDMIAKKRIHRQPQH